MKKSLSLLGVLTITGTSLPTVFATRNYKKENQNKKMENEIINIGGKKHKKEKIEFNLYKKDNEIINNIFFDEKNTPYVVVQIIEENKNINEVEVFNLWTKQKEIDDLNNIEEFFSKSNHNFKLKNNIFWKDDEKIIEFIIFLKHNKNYVYFCDSKKDIFKYKIQENKVEKIYTNTNPDWKLIDFVVDNNENLYFINEFEKSINIYNLLNHNTDKKTLDYIPLSLAFDDDDNIYCVGELGFNILKQNNILNINLNKEKNKKIVVDNNSDIYTINLENEIIKMTKINSDLELSNNNDFFKKNWIYFATIIPITLIIFTSTIFLFLYIKKFNKIKHKLNNSTCYCKICNKN